MFNKKISDNWNYKSQLEAYKTGIKTNWSYPIGTSDIHSLKKIKNAKAYLGKYVTKNPEVEKETKKQINDYCIQNSVDSINRSVYNQIVTDVKKKLSIIGNIWYISQNLSKCKGVHMDQDYTQQLELRNFESLFPDKVIYKDFCCIFLINIYEVFKLKLVTIGNCFRDYILELRARLYPKDLVNSSPLGIPLFIFD
jgi:hypothetical protein